MGAGNLKSDLCAYVAGMLQTEPVGDLEDTRPSTEFSLFLPDFMIPDVRGLPSPGILSGQRNSHVEDFPQQHRKAKLRYSYPALRNSATVLDSSLSLSQQVFTLKPGELGRLSFGSKLCIFLYKDSPPLAF